jgi:hypothetical protein
MKNFLKLFAVIIVIAFTTESYAQTFGIKAGANLSNMSIDAFDEGMDTKTNLGFNVGVTAEFPITDLFSFETGLMLNTKGFRINEEAFGVTILDLKANVFYLDIPLTAKASFDVGGAKLYALAGPYVAAGLFGKMKMESDLDPDDDIDEDIEFGSDDDQWKRLDYGVLVGAGVEFGKISVGAT